MRLLLRRFLTISNFSVVVFFPPAISNRAAHLLWSILVVADEWSSWECQSNKRSRDAWLLCFLTKQWKNTFECFLTTHRPLVEGGFYLDGVPIYMLDTSLVSDSISASSSLPKISSRGNTEKELTLSRIIKQWFLPINSRHSFRLSNALIPFSTELCFGMWLQKDFDATKQAMTSPFSTTKSFILAK